MTDPLTTADSPRRNPLGRVLGGVTHWMPVWAPLGLLAILGLRGLKPALLEDQRLRTAEKRLTQRLDALREQRDELDNGLQSLEDPIYIERLRRLRDGN